MERSPRSGGGVVGDAGAGPCCRGGLWRDVERNGGIALVLGSHASYMAVNWGGPVHCSRFWGCVSLYTSTVTGQHISHAVLA